MIEWLRNDPGEAPVGTMAVQPADEYPYDRLNTTWLGETTV